MLDQLNLSDTQREQIRTLHESARTEGEKFHEQMKANRDQIEALVTGGAFDEAQARKLLATKAQLMTEMDLIHLRTDAAVYALLTPEQRAQAQQLKQDRPPFPPPPFRGERPADGK
jgi:Spy/CpxP family protein refolding chaperone